MAEVLLAPLEFVQSHLAEGRLMRPFDVEPPSAHGFHLVAPAARFDQPDAAAFRRLLRVEVRAAFAVEPIGEHWRAPIVFLACG
jgi:DNA-binding transcriptional LysR family regulator